ncbi:hypothetical protein CRU92_07190 [Arcobacter sp. FW59]|nr:hypothetical protein CRU92_07190 [Arcobacter sp. FW59]
MKIYISIIIFLLSINNTFSDEIKEEQIKVAYVYNFLKNISWKNDENIKSYKLMIVSQNQTLNNMFKMLASRKQLNDKNIEVIIYNNTKVDNIQAIFIDKSSEVEYEKLYYEYEKNNTLLISDNYANKKQVMINLLQNDSKITFEINKANILNRDLTVSSDIILLGGTEIDVAQLYKSSQVQLKEQKETITSLNKNIEDKNKELKEQLKAIDQQKTIISDQIKNIKVQNEQLTLQKKELSQIYTSIEEQKEKLFIAQNEAIKKEKDIKNLINLQLEQEKTFEDAKNNLDLLMKKIDEQNSSILVKEEIITNQKNIIFVFFILLIIILALGLNVLRQNRLLKNLSETDTLSGLYNRRYTLKRLEEEVSRFKRYKTPFSIILLDIDFFKKINDTYGHDKGDFVIKQISEIFKQHTRKTDICARWGGEEFLILASNSDIQSATKLAEILRKVVENSDFGINQKVTISLGVATLSENSDQDVVLKLADELLYKAKSSGRNKVIAA